LRTPEQRFYADLARFITAVINGPNLVLAKAQSDPISMIKCFPATEIEDKIRKRAATLNMPPMHYLTQLLKASANGNLTMVPCFLPQVREKKVA